jgi:FixJ family two-component response regulator
MLSTDARRASSSLRPAITTASGSAPSPAAAAAAATIHVIDDDAMLRRSLADLVTSAGMRAQVYACAEEFLEQFNANEPGCILMDLRMPGMTGVQLVEELHRRRCTTPIIVLSAFADVPTAVRVLKSGAIDLLEKPFSSAVLLDRIVTAVREDAHRRSHQRLVQDVQSRMDTLTQREIQVLDLVVTGMASKQIAAELSLSIKTIEYHRTRIMMKLNVSNVAELVHAVSVARAFQAAKSN